MIKVTIDRSRWFRGQTSAGSALQREVDGQRCCLGFCALAVGFAEKDIVNVASPENLPLRQGYSDQMREFREAKWQTAMMVNDRRSNDGQYSLDNAIPEDFLPDSLPSVRRERYLAELLFNQGFDVEFVDTLEERNSDESHD